MDAHPRQPPRSEPLTASCSWLRWVVIAGVTGTTFPAFCENSQGGLFDSESGSCFVYHEKGSWVTRNWFAPAPRAPTSRHLFLSYARVEAFRECSMAATEDPWVTYGVHGRLAHVKTAELEDRLDQQFKPEICWIGMRLQVPFQPLPCRMEVELG